MAATAMALTQELAQYVAQKYNEGILERQFEDIRDLQDAESPTFVPDLLILYCQDNERLMRTLETLTKPVLDFPRVSAYVHRLKGSSVSVGAKQVKLACTEFRSCAERNDEPGCIRSLFMIKHEFYRAKSTFERIAELERSIIAHRRQNGPQS